MSNIGVSHDDQIKCIQSTDTGVIPTEKRLLWTKDWTLHTILEVSRNVVVSLSETTTSRDTSRFRMQCTDHACIRDEVRLKHVSVEVFSEASSLVALARS